MRPARCQTPAEAASTSSWGMWSDPSCGRKWVMFSDFLDSSSGTCYYCCCFCTVVSCLCWSSRGRCAPTMPYVIFILSWAFCPVHFTPPKKKTNFWCLWSSALVRVGGILLAVYLESELQRPHIAEDQAGQHEIVWIDQVRSRWNRECLLWTSPSMKFAGHCLSILSMKTSREGRCAVWVSGEWVWYFHDKWGEAIYAYLIHGSRHLMGGIR